mmetsp:Transcript_33786/g.86352  ORF Transcript_33786/g.86352 Transcript_33786/m.86352 type:complete len:307 (-) Transcript_33786:774-1694(-)
MSSSAFSRMALAMASRMRQPPLSSETSCPLVASVKPTLLSASLTSAVPTPMFSVCSSRYAVTLCCTTTRISCCTKTHLMPAGKPLMSFCAMRPSSVDFPTPFCPTSPYLCPRRSFRSLFLSSTRPAKAMMMFSQLTRKSSCESSCAPAGAAPPSPPSPPAAGSPPPRSSATTSRHSADTASSLSASSSIGPTCSASSSAVSATPPSASSSTLSAMPPTYSTTSASRVAPAAASALVKADAASAIVPRPTATASRLHPSPGLRPPLPQAISAWFLSAPRSGIPGVLKARAVADEVCREELPVSIPTL